MQLPNPFNTSFNDDEPILGASEALNAGSCMQAPCGNVGNSTNKLKWTAIYPQGHLSSAQGFVGQRMAYFTGSQLELYNTLENIFNSSWPGPAAWCNDCLPVDIQWGPSSDERSTRVFGNIPDNQISHKLEAFNEYRIVVTYQLLRISDQWPMTGKPIHPKGSVLYLQVRGGCEVLQVDPTGLHTGGAVGLCFANGTTEIAPGFQNTISGRIRVPLTEYHLTCDRLTNAQLCGIMSVPWKCREGTVNCFQFLGEDYGTLLFDTWALEPVFAPDLTEPRRWRLSCVLKARDVPQLKGNSPNNCFAAATVYDTAIGWNHDYKRNTADNKLGWLFIMLDVGPSWTEAGARVPTGVGTNTTCPKPLAPRYPYRDFSDLFGCRNTALCLPEREIDSSCASECEEPNCFTDDAIGNIRGSEEHNPKLEEMIAEIVHDSRGARGRSMMRHQQEELEGRIQEWPETSKT